MNEALQLTVDGQTSAAFKLFIVLTALSFAPAVIISLTSFTRIIIVLSFLRQALGTQNLPPNQVLIGLALFLSVFVMGATLDDVYAKAVAPFLDDKISMEEAAEAAKEPLAAFMVKQTREDDLRLFYALSERDRPSSGEAIPFSVLVPAFMISELTTAFRMGITLFIPLLLIDLLVSTLLMALGMMMMPPTLVSLPIKLGVFVLADGWRLVIGSLAASFG